MNIFRLKALIKYHATPASFCGILRAFLAAHKFKLPRRMVNNYAKELAGFIAVVSFAPGWLLVAYASIVATPGYPRLPTHQV